MRVVSAVGDGGVGEEAVVEEGAFEEEVGECVEEVPDEDDTELGCCGGVKEGEGGDVSGYQESEGCEEGEDGCLVDYEWGGWGLSGHCWVLGILEPR